MLNNVADKERFHRNRAPSLDKTWFLFQLLGSADHQIEVGCFTIWAGRSTRRPFRELRKAGPVNPLPCLEIMEDAFERPILVDDSDSLFTWFLFGGVGLIEQTIARETFPYDCAPHEVGRTSSDSGFVSIDGLPATTLQHAPTPKVRTQVFLRDNRRCRLCGRSPDEDVHAHLDLHHGIPWGGGHSGLTVPKNLFTLCTTCHKGLPDEYWKLLQVIETDEVTCSSTGRASYFEGVTRYREEIAKDLGWQGANSPNDSSLRSES